MAIYHFSAQIISRSTGRSSVAAASYRAGEKTKNERDGILHDYTKKSGVVHTEIMLPESAPSEYADRSTLWNAVEKSEKRCDAQTAREIDIALPVELNLKENIELVREYIKDNFVSHGMCADFAIHDTGSGNPHAHIMLTTREITNAGFGKKNRDWNDKSRLEVWRENWANICNERLKQKGLNTRIDHRTLEAQGIDREPTMHIGATAQAMERRGLDSDRVRENREIIAGNKNRTPQTPQEIAEYLHELSESYIIAEGELKAIRRLDFKMERIEERASQIEAHKTRLAELQVERQRMNVFQSKKNIDRLIERQKQTYESARNYFIHEYKIRPEQAHAEIYKLQYQSTQLKNESILDFHELTYVRNLISTEYRAKRFAVERSNDKQEVLDHLKQLQKLSTIFLSPREILQRERIEKKLYNNSPRPPERERRRERWHR